MNRVPIEHSHFNGSSSPESSTSQRYLPPPYPRGDDDDEIYVSPTNQDSRYQKRPSSKMSSVRSNHTLSSRLSSARESPQFEAEMPEETSVRHRQDAVLDDSRTSVKSCKDITIHLEPEREYVKCKRVDSKAIWQYMRAEDSKLTEQDRKLLKYCIAQVEKIKKPFINTNMQLRVYTENCRGPNPVFYAGCRNRNRYVALWTLDEEPEFICVKQSIFSYVPWFLMVIVITVIIVAALLYLIHYAADKTGEFLLLLAGSFNATINIAGESKSDLSFDDLDININMNAGR